MVDYGIIFDLKKFAIHDGPGIRTTVFLKGCPLSCQWCHNPESRSEGIEEFRTCTPRSGDDTTPATLGCRISADRLMADILRDEIFYDQSGGGVTFSGGEPMLQVEFLETMLRRCRAAGVHTAVDTSGYCLGEAFEKITGLVDLFLYDLKLMDEIEHVKYVGVSNDLILANLKRLSAVGANIRIRVPMIPDISDTERNLDAVASFLTPMSNLRRISLLPYNKFGEDKRRRYRIEGGQSWSTQPEATIARKQLYLQERGFQVTVGG